LDGAGAISGGGTNPYRYRHVGMTAQILPRRGTPERQTEREKIEEKRCRGVEGTRGRGVHLFITWF